MVSLVDVRDLEFDGVEIPVLNGHTFVDLSRSRYEDPVRNSPRWPGTLTGVEQASRRLSIADAARSSRSRTVD
jgi:hypothetical protein